MDNNSKSFEELIADALELGTLGRECEEEGMDDEYNYVKRVWRKMLISLNPRSYFDEIINQYWDVYGAYPHRYEKRISTGS